MKILRMRGDRRPVIRASTTLGLGVALLALALATAAARDAQAGLGHPLRSVTERSVSAQASEAFTPLHAQLGGAMNVAFFHRDTLWLGLGPRIAALDVADPSAPRLLGRSRLLPDVVQDAALAPVQERAWVVAGDALVTVDLSLPASPILRGTADLPGRSSRVALAGGLGWVLLEDGRVIGFRDAGAGGLVSGPEAMLPPPPEGYEAADVAGNAGALFRLERPLPGGDGASLLRAFLLSPSRGPTALPAVELPRSRSHDGYSGQLEWHAERLWARDGQQLLRFREAAGILVLESEGDFNIGGIATSMALEGYRAYLSLESGWSDNLGIAAFDVFEAGAPHLLVGPEWKVGAYPGVLSRAMAARGRILWAGSSGGQLSAVDMREGAGGAALGAFASAGELGALALDGRSLHALGPQSAQVLDLTTPAAPRHAGLLVAGFHYAALDADEGLVGLAIAGQADTLYDKLQLIDARDPSMPRSFFEEEPPEPGRTGDLLTMGGGLLAWATTDYQSGFVSLLDLRAGPLPPRRSDELRFEDARLHALRLQEGELLLSLTSEGETLRLHRDRLVDGASAGRQSLDLITGLGTWPEAWLAASATRAYVLLEDPDPSAPAGDPRRRLRLASARLDDPDRLLAGPTIALPCAADCDPRDLALADGHLFLAKGDRAAAAGIEILALDDPERPRLVQTYRSRKGIQGLATDAEHVYAAAGAGGLEVYGRPPGGWSEAPEPIATPTIAPTVTPLPRYRLALPRLLR